MDGSGNLVITAKEPYGSLVCYYGPCERTSARLISQYRAEFADGRLCLVTVTGSGDTNHLARQSFGVRFLSH